VAHADRVDAALALALLLALICYGGGRWLNERIANF